MSVRATIIKAFMRSQMIIVGFFCIWRDYSFLYSLYSTLWWVGWYAHINRLTNWAYQKKRSYIFKYMEDNYSDIIKQYSCNLSVKQSIDSYPIWVFWAQGFENAPELVRMCNTNLLKIQDNVKLVTLDNVRSYVNIPQYIFDRVDNKTMTLIHFSDILRASLLSKYGGIWVDSTCYFSEKIPRWVAQHRFFSPRSIDFNSLWCSWSMGSNERNSTIFSFLRDILLTHAKNNKYFIDYLFMDFVILYAYKHFDDVREMVDSCPRNNTKRNNLHFLLNKSYSEEIYNDLTSHDWLFKLSYKTPWRRKDRDGNITFYGKLLEDNGL